MIGWQLDTNQLIHLPSNWWKSQFFFWQRKPCELHFGKAVDLPSSKCCQMFFSPSSGEEAARSEAIIILLAKQDFLLVFVNSLLPDTMSVLQCILCCQKNQWWNCIFLREQDTG